MPERISRFLVIAFKTDPMKMKSKEKTKKATRETVNPALADVQMLYKGSTAGDRENGSHIKAYYP